MRVLPQRGGPILGFWVSLLLALVTFCYCSDKTVVEVVGVAECSDCAQYNIKSSQALSGLGVAIDCKAADGKFKTRGVGKIDADGKFRVTLPSEIAKEEGQLTKECVANVQTASGVHCTVKNEASKIILASKSKGKLTLGLRGKLTFSPATCTSAFFWPPLKFPPLPKWRPFNHPWFKHFDHNSPIVFPPIYKKPLPPPFPIYSHPPLVIPPIPFFKPLHSSRSHVRQSSISHSLHHGASSGREATPPPVPTYTPKPPVVPPVVVKPLPPPVPTYTPKPPVVVKPLPPPVPTYTPKPPVVPPVVKKPCPPKAPTYTPKPPVVKKPCPPKAPTYTPKPPVVKKPCPPKAPTYTPKPKPQPPVVEKPLLHQCQLTHLSLQLL
ncbi:hypothetical protein Sjap_016757 [Stephania japonica]|uniref:Uncharacterized protein n=1 Tax=Stephania japonica TaxID=461633 RepID=A0AAP0NHP2_9MAGN